MRYLIEYRTERYSDYWVDEHMLVDSDEELCMMLDRLSGSMGYDLRSVSRVLDSGIRRSSDVRGEPR